MKANNSQPEDRLDIIPKPILVMAGLLIAVSITAAYMSKRSGDSVTAQVLAAQTKIDQRYLSFEDRDDGSIRILDAESGEHVETLVAGEGAFVRGVLRSLARERRLSGRNVSNQKPFLLVMLERGELLLEDPETTTVIYLAAYGRTNQRSFAELLLQQPVS